MENPIHWPEGKQFAFTIIDDADLQTVDNASPVYAFLCDLGFRTTKTVWPVRGHKVPKVGGATCEDEHYLKWTLGLKELGFEIGLHNVTYHTSTREETVRGLERFRQLFGHYPHTMANHTGCADTLYWGGYRLNGINRILYNLLHGNGHRELSEGHLEKSPLFWGDLCKEKIKYVRNFTFRDINTFKMCPVMPYHDPDRAYVNYWFAASEGANVNSFNYILSEPNQDRLRREGGACIIYTHLARGFAENDCFNQRFRYLMERLSTLNGWFVPVCTLLDYILKVRGRQLITNQERTLLERRWMMHKLLGTRGRS